MKMLLGHEWVDRDDKIDVRDPFDDSLIDTVPAATHEDVETAMATAAEARATARALSTYDHCGAAGGLRPDDRPRGLEDHQGGPRRGSPLREHADDSGGGGEAVAG